MSYCVYKHTFPNEKVYIGITGQRPEKRWRSGFGYSHNSRLKNAIAKYGWENIKHEILFDGLTKEEACQREIELIAQYRSNDRQYGYNMSTGGEKGGNGVRGVSAWNKGKRGCYSQEIKERISNGLKTYYKTHKCTSSTKFVKGQEPWNKGKNASQELREKLSKAKRGVTGEKANRSKPVLQYSLDNQFIKRYASATAAAKDLGLKCCGSITHCCNGQSKSAGGYIWKYERND